MMKIPRSIPLPIAGAISDDIMLYLMQAGQQAPSGENTQPWFISRRENTLIVELDPLADPSVYNVRQLASAIACGAVVCNICVAASHFHLMADVQIQQAQDEILKVVIELTPSSIEKSPLADYIWQRHTNRTTFNGQPIPNDSLMSLKQVCSTIPGATLDLFTDQEDLDRIAKIIYDADILRMQIKSAHRLLMSNIHFDEQEALKSRMGMHIKNLEVGWDGELFIKLTKTWKVANFMNKIGMDHIAAKLASKGAKQASAMGLIRVKGMDIHAFFKGGMALENIWLEATRLGLSFQPMTIPTFLWMNKQLGQSHLFDLKSTIHLDSTLKKYQNFFPCEDNETHILLFRLGYGKPMRMGTFRKDIVANSI